MANELNITIIGRLTEAPELRFTPSGAPVANFTIAQNSRVFDKQSNEWKDKPTNFFRCSIWREAAENAAESLEKGSAVIAYGEVTSRSYETKEGQQRTVQEIELQHIGPDLKWATAKVTKAQRQNNSSGGFGGNRQAAAQEDPWATPAVNPNNGGGWGNGPDSEPPF